MNNLLFCIHIAKIKICYPFWTNKAFFLWISYFSLHSVMTGWRALIYDGMLWNTQAYIVPWAYIISNVIVFKYFQILFNFLISVYPTRSIELPSFMRKFLSMHRFYVWSYIYQLLSRIKATEYYAYFWLQNFASMHVF